MLRALREFRIGRPQIFAGLLLLGFLFECLWVSAGRRFSDLEYEYIASGFKPAPGQAFRATSPFTGLVAALPVRVVDALKTILPAARASLSIPRPWFFRLPFVILVCGSEARSGGWHGVCLAMPAATSLWPSTFFHMPIDQKGLG